MCALNNCLFSCVKKWVPAIKEQWVVITTQVKPHVQSLTAKTVEVYEASRTTITPHIIRVQEIADPYFQVCAVILPLIVYLPSYLSSNMLNLTTGSKKVW